MYNIKDILNSIRTNFQVTKIEIRNIILISLFIGLGLSSNGFSKVVTFGGTINHLFTYFSIVFLTFTFFIGFIKLFASILKYEVEFNIGLIGCIVLLFLIIFSGGNLILASIIFLISLGVEAFYFMNKAKPEGRILVPFKLKYTSIEHKRINLDKNEKSTLMEQSWILFAGYIGILILYTINIKTPNFLAHTFYAQITQNFLLWFIIYFLIPLPPFPGFQMLYASRTGFAFQLAFILIYLILIHILSILTTLVISLILALIIIYLYHYHYDIYLYE